MVTNGGRAMTPLLYDSNDKKSPGSRRPAPETPCVFVPVVIKKRDGDAFSTCGHFPLEGESEPPMATVTTLTSLLSAATRAR